MMPTMPAAPRRSLWPAFLAALGAMALFGAASWLLLAAGGPR